MIKQSHQTVPLRVVIQVVGVSRPKEKGSWYVFVLHSTPRQRQVSGSEIENFPCSATVSPLYATEEKLGQECYTLFVLKS